MPDQQATQRLSEILTRISKLPSANLEPPQFFANFLQLTVAATGSRGGAIWILQPGQGPQCYCHLELPLCKIEQPQQQKVILQAVQQTVQEGKPLVLPGAGENRIQQPEQGQENLCEYTLFFKPIRAAGQVAMVLQVIGSERIQSEDYRGIVALLEKACEAAETYLAHRRASLLEDDRKSLAKLLNFSQQVHNTLDTEKVVYEIANTGREAIGCERVVVWIKPEVKRALRAVSGIDKPDHRAVLIQAIEKLGRYCLQVKKPIVAARDQLVELAQEEELTELLRNYFNVSQLDQIYLQPLTYEQQYLGVVVAEGFDPQNATSLAGIITSIAQHGGIALHNALEIAAMPVIKPLARFKKVRDDPEKRKKWLWGLAIAALVILALLVVPWNVRIECQCRLRPKAMRSVQSSLENVKIVRIEKPSGQVAQDQLIAVLDDLDLKTELFSLQQSLEQERIKRDRTGDTERKYIELQMAALQNEIKFKEYQIDQCQVRSPIAGTIITDQLELKEGLTLRKGDTICEVADLGHWQLELEVPHEEIEWVQQGLRENEDCLVQYFLAAFPQYKLSAHLSDESQISQTAHISQEKGNVFLVRLDTSKEELEKTAQGLRDGMIGRAKIETVTRPVGYVLLRKVIRFFRVTWF